MSTFDGKIRVVDFTNKQALVELASAIGLGQGTGITKVSDIAYMSNAFGLINVFDVSDSVATKFLTQCSEY
tara:strand:- start:28 stop:240 length:213 start_codon:yes stop_codon:yes gene_type:complete